MNIRGRVLISKQRTGQKFSSWGYNVRKILQRNFPFTCRVTQRKRFRPPDHLGNGTKTKFSKGAESVAFDGIDAQGKVGADLLERLPFHGFFQDPALDGCERAGHLSHPVFFQLLWGGPPPHTPDPYQPSRRPTPDEHVFEEPSPGPVCIGEGPREDSAFRLQKQHQDIPG